MGAVAALVLAGGIAAAVVYLPGLASRSSSPEEAAQSVKPGFVGRKQIGAWDLVCEKLPQRPMPKFPPWFKRGKNTIVTSTYQAGGHKQLAISVWIPPRPCWVGIRLQESKNLSNLMFAHFALRGPRGVLVLLFRFPTGLLPDPPKGGLPPDVQPAPGGVLHVQWDGGDRAVPARYCEAVGCIAPMLIRPADEAKFLATRKFVLSFPSSQGKPGKVFDIPTDGMKTAVATMRRLEK